MTEPEHRELRDVRVQDLVDRTGIDEAMITRLVHGFYGRVREDATLGPIFAAEVEDWDEHLRTLVDFWSSVALMTARYGGRPMPAHVKLEVGEEHFARWLELFRQTAHEVCTPEAAAFFIGKAETIARSFQMGIAFHRGR
ncbi:MAG TPA: group III truncated hemoglobin [Azospirillum sp.]|nr:group III truncated hemoglobin [Azospirillum sp.]